MINAEKDKPGISVVVCCYNSSSRITATLEALSRQVVNPAVSWEILLVDNASSDTTADAAKAAWRKLGAKTPFTITYEAMPGLSNARSKGIREARYSIVLFCDDDNWLCTDYVQKTFDILIADHTLAACGGRGIPVFENDKPYWFEEYAEAFATGGQELNVADNRILSLYGAGLAIKKSAFNELQRAGFTPELKDRVGKKLSSAGDTELTYALVLLGYKLHYAPDLTFFHFLPSQRLTQEYLKNLFTAFGSDGPVRNLYYAHISNRYFHKKLRNWNFHLALTLFRMTKYFIMPPKRYGRFIYLQWNIAYMQQLWQIRNRYHGIIDNILRIKKHTIHH